MNTPPLVSCNICEALYQMGGMCICAANTESAVGHLAIQYWTGPYRCKPNSDVWDETNKALFCQNLK
jgi:hypothetical protein